MRKKKIMTKQELAFQICMIVLFSLLFLLCFYPFYYIFIASLTNPQVPSSQIGLLPVRATLSNYQQIFAIKGIGRAFLVSVARTVIGTAVTIFFTSILAFCVTQKELPLRKFFYRFTVVAMYISAGLIPWYLSMRSLQLKDSFLIYILPSAVSAYCMVLIKTYMESIPQSLEESARIDGAGYFTIYSKIVMPMCFPVIAAVAVFTAVQQWNSWTDNLLLVNENNLQTLQMKLMEYLNQATNIAQQAQNGGVDGATAVLSPFTVRMTITMVVTLPILAVYPFVQKYFVKGIMLGAVKG